MNKWNIGQRVKWRIRYWWDNAFIPLYLQFLFSPFKNLKLYWSFGNITHGHPYFYPRRWNKKGKPVYIQYFGYGKNGLGYKTKWYNTDFRFEYSPSFSIVFLKKQLFVCLITQNNEILHVFWETFLLYKYYKRKYPKKKAFLKTIKDNSNIYHIYHKGGTKEKVCYYPTILKKKWLKFYENNTINSFNWSSRIRQEYMG